MAYIYGASIQGIQGFIFETNKLKEIVGASEIIEYISTDFFEKYLKKDNNNEIIRNAAGNIRILFRNKDDASKMVLDFPKEIQAMAYGITVSQAVVNYDESKDSYLNKIEELEKKLKFARNRASLPLDAKFAILKQCARTAKPLYTTKNKEEYDLGSWQKLSENSEAQFNILLNKLNIEESNHEYFQIEMNNISNINSKVAVIHADGNKMGLLLQQIKKHLEDNKTSAKDVQEAYKRVSDAITKATLDAVKEAYEETFKSKYENKKYIPFRPIVIGGDDVTVLCNADDALKFCKIYLEKFEEYTEKKFNEKGEKKSIVEKYGLSKFENGLTACAGIAFNNEKFPFHYAIELAEKLCSFAKEESARAHSCLMFHNIQSSFFINYKDYVKDELNANGISLQFGPYYTNRDNAPKIEALSELFKIFSKDDVPKGKYRECLKELHKNRKYAKLMNERINAVLDGSIKKDLNEKLKDLDSNLSVNNLVVKRVKKEKDGKETTKFFTPIHDLMQLSNILGGANNE